MRVSNALVLRQGFLDRPRPGQPRMNRVGQPLRRDERIRYPLRGTRIFVIARIPGQRPTVTVRFPEEISRSPVPKNRSTRSPARSRSASSGTIYCRHEVTLDVRLDRLKLVDRKHDDCNGQSVIGRGGHQKPPWTRTDGHPVRRDIAPVAVVVAVHHRADVIFLGAHGFRDNGMPAVGADDDSGLLRSRARCAGGPGCPSPGRWSM